MGDTRGIEMRRIPRMARSYACKEGRHADCNGFLIPPLEKTDGKRDQRSSTEKCLCSCDLHGLKG